MKITFRLPKIPKNFFQKIGMIIGLIMFFFGLWQLDLLMCPYIWNGAEQYKLWTINYWLFPNMVKGQAYDLLFAFLVTSLVIVVFSLWLWNENKTEDKT